MNFSSESFNFSNFQALTAQFKQAGEMLSSRWQAAKAQAGEFVTSGMNPDVVATLEQLLSECGHVIKASPTEALALAGVQKKYAGLHVQLLKQVAANFGLMESTSDSTVLTNTDKRFSDAAWAQSPLHAYQAQAYVLSANALLEALGCVALSPELQRKTRFYVNQLLDAVAPSNNLFTNPEALALAVATNGESLKSGMANLQRDMEQQRISITDESAFEVGRNLAITPGSVVFENDIFQLIQYAPSTNAVHLRPLLIVPPCINKYYILDLAPDNSFVKYAVSRGHTVFIISWRNVGADAAHALLTWDDYLRDGVIKAIDTVRLISNVEQINLLGFCVGGTLLTSALAVLARMGHDVAQSLTLLTTFLDFSDVGDIQAYVDHNLVTQREKKYGGPEGGIMPGRDLAFAFSSLRANDLVWSYVINNYLKGKQPVPFDLLYWNGDSTNLPGPWYCTYLRNTYFENNLIKPDKLTMCGQAIDIGLLDCPAYVFAAKEDHIVPWQTAYTSAKFLNGNTQFVLGASGHIAGVINSVAKNKRSYWSNEKANPHAVSADDFIAGAVEHPGSWWPNWAKWLESHAGRTIPARNNLGGGEFRIIEAAPGRYVKERAPEV
jgi:polyhydroxyalkanoate synthase subunit PhaC